MDGRKGGRGQERKGKEGRREDQEHMWEQGEKNLRETHSSLIQCWTRSGASHSLPFHAPKSWGCHYCLPFCQWETIPQGGGEFTKVRANRAPAELTLKSQTLILGQQDRWSPGGGALSVTYCIYIVPPDSTIRLLPWDCAPPGCREALGHGSD